MGGGTGARRAVDVSRYRRPARAINGGIDWRRCGQQWRGGGGGGGGGGCSPSVSELADAGAGAGAGEMFEATGYESLGSRHTLRRPLCEYCPLAQPGSGREGRQMGDAGRGRADSAGPGRLGPSHGTGVEQGWNGVQ